MYRETPEMNDTPGGNGWGPIQTIALPEGADAAPVEGLAEMSAAELWTGLRELVGADVAHALFDATLCLVGAATMLN